MRVCRQLLPLDARAYSVVPSLLRRSRLEKSHLPFIHGDVVAQNEEVPLDSLDLEVPVVGSQPGIDHLPDLVQVVAKVEAARRLLAPVAGVALDT